MSNKNTKSKDIDVDAYAERANKSSITIPRIKEKSQGRADKKACKMLNTLYDAFVTAEADAIKFAVADICNGLGMGKSLYPLEN